jgi:hypothetical protein
MATKTELAKELKEVNKEKDIMEDDKNLALEKLKEALKLIEIDDVTGAYKAVQENKKDNLVTKLLMFVMGDAGRSKRARMMLISFVTAGLTFASSKFTWIDPAWAGGLALAIIYLGGMFVKTQGNLDLHTDGNTSANPPK